MPVRIPLAAALLIAFAAFGPVPARAFSPASERPWTADSPCGKYRFVMKAGFRAGDTAETQRYPSSGLYKIDAPAVPLWAVRWYAWPWAVKLTSAGKYLVITHAQGWDAGVWDVHIFIDGRLIRSRPGAVFVDCTWGIVYAIEREIDADAGTFWMTTQDGNAFLFDLKTGEIIWLSRPWRVARGILAAILLVLNASLAWWLFIRKGRGGRRPDCTPRQPQERPPSEAGHKGITHARR